MIATNVTIVFADDTQGQAEKESTVTDDAYDKEEIVTDDAYDKEVNDEELLDEKVDKLVSPDEEKNSEDEPTDTEPAKGDEKVGEDLEEGNHEEKEDGESEVETGKIEDKEEKDKTDVDEDEAISSENEEKVDENIDEDEEATSEDEDKEEDEELDKDKGEEESDEASGSLAQLTKLFASLRTTEQANFNAGSWKIFIEKLEEVDKVLSDESELAGASEEYLNDLIAELSSAYDNLEEGIIDATEVMQAYEAFQKKYQGINIVDLMDFYEDGYYNQFMLDYIEEYITLNQENVTTSENAHLLEFLAALDESLEEELTRREEEKNRAKETPKKDTSKNEVKKKEKEARLIKDEKIQAQMKKQVEKAAEKNPVQKASQLQAKVKSFKEVVVTPIGETVTSTAATVSDFRTLYLLPNTATPYYKYVVVGTLMIIEGLFLFLYFRFFSFVRKRFGFF